MKPASMLKQTVAVSIPPASDLASVVNTSLLALDELTRRAQEHEELVAALLWVFPIVGNKVWYDRSTERIEVYYLHNDHLRYWVDRDVTNGETFPKFVLRAFRTRGGDDP